MRPRDAPRDGEARLRRLKLLGLAIEIMCFDLTIHTHEHFINRNPIFCIILGSLESLAVRVRLLRRRLPPLHFLSGIVA